jgi:hypothetical protein
MRCALHAMARRRPAISAGLVAAVVAVGCSRKPLQELDPPGSGGAGMVSIDGGPFDPPDAASDGPLPIDVRPGDTFGSERPPTDGALDLPSDRGSSFAGGRSFVVTSLLRHDGGTSAAAPPSHVFTLVIDADQRSVIGGAHGQGGLAGLEPAAAGAFHVVGSLGFSLGAECSGWITYTDLTFTIDANGNLAGTGRGVVMIGTGDVFNPSSTSATLLGAPDLESPQLTIKAAGSLADPLTSFSVLSSEPLPAGASPALISASGDSIPLTPATILNTLVQSFSKPSTMLRHGEHYRLSLDGLADFAGFAAMGGGSFTTAAPPPLAVEDGFESLSGATFAGADVLFSEAGAPTITGARSLYLAPIPWPAQPAPFTVRLMRAPGDTVVQFTYRTVNPGPSPSSLVFGSVGGQIAGALLPSNTALPATSATIGGTRVILGPLMTARFNLPAGAANELVVQRTVPPPNCSTRPLPEISGLIIDDLRLQ